MWFFGIGSSSASVGVEFWMLLREDILIHMISRRMTVFIFWVLLGAFEDLRVGDLTSIAVW